MVAHTVDIRHLIRKLAVYPDAVLAEVATGGQSVSMTIAPIEAYWRKL